MGFLGKLNPHVLAPGRSFEQILQMIQRHDQRTRVVEQLLARLTSEPVVLSIAESDLDVDDELPADDPEDVPQLPLLPLDTQSMTRLIRIAQSQGLLEHGQLGRASGSSGSSGLGGGAVFRPVFAVVSSAAGPHVYARQGGVRD